MLLASGVNFGFVALLPALGFGLGAVLTALPSLHLAFKIVGGGYLLYLAYRIAMSARWARAAWRKSAADDVPGSRRFSMDHPKAWVMAVTAMAVYANPDAPYLSVLIIGFAFAAVNFPSASVWSGFDTA